jgi:AAA+ ATPase superfamily predicted ATPase
VTLPKPSSLHDRERPWRTLANFATSPAEGSRLALVYGRRRQGKTILLDQLTRATGGFLFTGLPEGGPLNLRRLARAYGEHVGGPTPAFEDWEQALDHLLRLGEGGDRPALVVLDEFPYLVESQPALPSIVQIALEPMSRARTRGRARLVLCGSALHVMRGLLAGSAPLRGRADLEVVLAPFGYRETASFWGVVNVPDIAFQLHALVGGTPAYRSMSGGDGAALDTPDAFAAWVADGPLNPDRAIYREGAVLLQEDPGPTDLRLYHSVLSAIAQGACRRSEIAGLLGRPDAALTHALAVLHEAQLVDRVEDGLRRRRPVYRIAEPVLRLHQLLIAPNDAALIGGRAAQVWSERADTVASRIYGPHFEELCRQWCVQHAAVGTLGGRPSRAHSSTLACRTHRQGHELDVVVTATEPGRADTVLAIGEAKSTAARVDVADLDRLEHLRDLVRADRGGPPPRLLLFSRSGFTAELHRRSTARDGVRLVDLDRLYTGD